MVSLRPGRRWRIPFAIGDSAVALAALYLAILVRVTVPLPFTRDLLPPDRVAYFDPTTLYVVALGLVALYLFGLYDSPEPRPRLQLASRLARAGVLQGLGLIAYLFLADAFFPRSVVLLFVGFDFGLLLVWRIVAHGIVRPERRRVLIVGRGPEAIELAREIASYHWHGLEVAGHVPIPGQNERDDATPELGPRLGTIDDIPTLLAEGRFDELVLAPAAESWQSRLMGTLAERGAVRPSVLLLPGPYESLVGRMRYRWVNDIPLIEVARPAEWSLYRSSKRVFDLLVGSALLLLALPGMAVVAIVVRVTSAGPVLYRQERIGRHQRPFTLLKFRTMAVGAEEGGDERLASVDDPRVTSVGAILRSTRLDELPQLLNVLGGTMSLVGPRPERPGFVRRYVSEIPGYAERFSLGPGITGLAQVNGDYHSSPANKLRYDLAYLANWSLRLDLSILFRTIRIILTSRGV